MASTNGTVFVFGSINADTSFRMTRLPAPGETVVASSARTSPGGKGANQAIASAAAGAATRMVGIVGNDSDGTALRTALAARDINTGSVTVSPETVSGRAVVYVDDAGENSIVVLSGANAAVSADTAATGLASISDGDALVLQNEVPADANRAAARLANAAGATVIWNAAPAPTTAADLVMNIDLLVVNEHELTQIGTLLRVANDPAATDSVALPGMLSAVARALNADAICTLGAEGAIFHVDGETGSVPAPKVRAVDTTAAGDTVVGYLAAHRTLPIRQRLQLAATAGALTVTREGASTSIPSLTDVEPLLAATTERTTA